jgi:hypothetical protein
MREPVLYHLDDQYAAALLRPMVSSLHELERRAQHYSVHLRMAPDDREAIAGAREILEEARCRLQEILERRIQAGGWKGAAG